MKPVVDGLEKEYGDGVEFRRYNVETDQTGVDLANKIGVQYVPTFLFVNSDGVVAKQTVGEMTKDQMGQQLSALQ